MIFLLFKLTLCFLGQIQENLYFKGAQPAPNILLPPKKIPKEFIVKYKRGEINPVSALHQFAQMQRVQLDLKETVATGKCFCFYKKMLFFATAGAICLWLMLVALQKLMCK